MSEPSSEITLEEVRNRFAEAEVRLTEAASAVTAIQDAASRLGSAREGLTELSGSLREVAASLADNATHLRQGVDAIRAGDPGEIKRQIEELDAAFTALQSVVGERLTKLEEQGAVTSASLASQMNVARRESRVVAVGLAILVIVAIAVALVT